MSVEIFSPALQETSMAFGFPTPIQAAQNNVSQMLTIIGKGNGTPCDAPADASDPKYLVTISAPPPGNCGGTTVKALETQSGDIFEHSTSATPNGDKWTSFGQAPAILY
jgi:hypothetical protein